MGIVYSRNGAAASLLVLGKLIKEIKTEYFRLDETRNGRIVETIARCKPAGESNVIHVKDESEVVKSQTHRTALMQILLHQLQVRRKSKGR